ncbi:MAG: hypothetical protein H7Y59_03190 [Anaerolineales bacterium]|nr:hypothetical protein [Anaerolineales bacterium]
MIATSNLDKAKSEIKKSIPQIIFAAIVVLALTLYEIYGAFSDGQLFSQQGFGMAFSFNWQHIMVCSTRAAKKRKQTCFDHYFIGILFGICPRNFH